VTPLPRAFKQDDRVFAPFLGSKLRELGLQQDNIGETWARPNLGDNLLDNIVVYDKRDRSGRFIRLVMYYNKSVYRLITKRHRLGRAVVLKCRRDI